MKSLFLNHFSYDVSFLYNVLRKEYTHNEIELQNIIEPAKSHLLTIFSLNTVAVDSLFHPVHKALNKTIFPTTLLNIYISYDSLKAIVYRQGIF